MQLVIVRVSTRAPRGLVLLLGWVHCFDEVGSSALATTEVGLGAAGGGMEIEVRGRETGEGGVWRGCVAAADARSRPTRSS